MDSSSSLRNPTHVIKTIRGHQEHLLYHVYKTASSCIY